jgi:NADH dehydrogenase
MKYDILLIGGNGFVGRVLAAQLQAEGYSVLLPTRHLASARELRMLPKVHLEDADVHEFDSLQELCSRIKPGGAVINWWVCCMTSLHSLTEKYLKLHM